MYVLKKTTTAELRRVQSTIKKELASEKIIQEIYEYIFNAEGKKTRALLCLLASKSPDIKPNSRINLASIIELLHTATLVHDDVVDNAFERRGFFSINALWKNKIAVLVGDYLLSRGLLLAIRNKEFKQLEIVSTAVEEMSEGELLQIEKSRGVNLNEEIYFEIIRQKTATLIASCCACGAASAGCDDEMIERMRMIGEKIGVAFQIKDDLFDYGLGGKIGKPTGIDIKEKKSTLPLIYALNHSANGEKRAMLRIVKKDNKKKAEIDKVIQYVLDSGGIEYADQKMRALSSEARTEILKLPAGEARDSLLALVEFTINREK